VQRRSESGARGKTRRDETIFSSSNRLQGLPGSQVCCKTVLVDVVGLLDREVWFVGDFQTRNAATPRVLLALARCFSSALRSVGLVVHRALQPQVADPAEIVVVEVGLPHSRTSGLVTAERPSGDLVRALIELDDLSAHGFAGPFPRDSEIVQRRETRARSIVGFWKAARKRS
jgi:hypothetical protein